MTTTLPDSRIGLPRQVVGIGSDALVRPLRVQLSRRKGWRMPPNTVKVCRPGKFGNPFVAGVDGTAAECVEKFAKDIHHPNGRVGFKVDDVATLRGKNLACWCKLGAPCHAEVLLDLANDPDEPQARQKTPNESSP